MTHDTVHLLVSYMTLSPSRDNTIAPLTLTLGLCNTDSMTPLGNVCYRNMKLKIDLTHTIVNCPTR